MQVLTVDIGTGTHEILLYDSEKPLEDALKLVMPSPTMIIRQRIREATRHGRGIILTGVIMGGGPNRWAIEDHLKAGLPAFATPDAARSFNDDLEIVQAMGIQLVGADETGELPTSYTRIEMCDFNFTAIANIFEEFGASLNELSAIAVAVFDHGNAPPGISDRQFRFAYLNQRVINNNRLTAFAYRAENIPPIMTRMHAVVSTVPPVGIPILIMDTAPAAVLGATFDKKVTNFIERIIINIGNGHTTAFHLYHDNIVGVFEHHTGILDCVKLEDLILSLADGSLENQKVFDEHGHGALIYPHQHNDPPKSPDIVVTGPQRKLMQHSRLNPYFATPLGDMMMSGCIGLLAATSELVPHLHQPILGALNGNGKHDN
jgi:uncharacterized protein (DUF1786 family)